MKKNEPKFFPVFLYSLTIIVVVVICYAAFFGVWVDRQMHRVNHSRITAQEFFDDNSPFATIETEKSTASFNNFQGPTEKPFSKGPSYPPPSKLKR